MSGTSEIRHKLMMWDKGQSESEGLASAVLANEGYKGIDPIHPLGGPDYGKDMIFRSSGSKWIGAVYFATEEKSFSDIKKKYSHDLQGVIKNNARGMAFICNQKLTETQRYELKGIAQDKEIDTDIYHLERLVSLLNMPIMYGVRLRFLDMAMSKEEELAYLEAVNKKQFDEIQKRLDDIYRCIISDNEEEEFWKFVSRSEEEVQNALEEFTSRVWYDRHMFLAYKIENGMETCDEKIWKDALAAAQKIREKYGENNLGAYSDFEWGMINGKLSALRWMLGEEWDILDT